MEELSVDDKLIDNFIHKYLGYGRGKADYWFIGKEEGGGENFDKVYEGIVSWWKNESKEFCDIKEGLTEENIASDVRKSFFIDKVKLKPTWNKLIRLIKSIENEGQLIDEIREFQKNKLGRDDGNNALIELFPLPNPNTNSWFYNGETGLKYLDSRQSYIDNVSHDRIELIKKRIKEYKPKAVIFYSTTYSYVKYWSQIIGEEVIIDPVKKYFITKVEETVYAVIPHPTSHGATKNNYINLGCEIRKELNKTNYWQSNTYGC